MMSRIDVWTAALAASPVFKQIILMGGNPTEMKAMAGNLAIATRTQPLAAFTQVLGPCPQTYQFAHAQQTWRLVRCLAVEALRLANPEWFTLRFRLPLPFPLDHEGQAIKSDAYKAPLTDLLVAMHVRENHMASDLFGKLLRNSGILD